MKSINEFICEGNNIVVKDKLNKSVNLSLSSNELKNELAKKLVNSFKFITGNNKSLNVDDFIKETNNGLQIKIWDIINPSGIQNNTTYAIICHIKNNTDITIYFNKNGINWIGNQIERRYYGMPDIQKEIKL